MNRQRWVAAEAGVGLASRRTIAAIKLRSPLGKSVAKIVSFH